MGASVTLMVPNPDAPYYDQRVDQNNPLPVSSVSETSSTVTTTTVASTTTATALIAANTSRKGVTIFNTDGNALYVLLASSGTPSATNANYVIPATTGYWEIPYGYTGPIRGAWAADGTGAALIGEFT
jgi:hypothetical protein